MIKNAIEELSKDDQLSEIVAKTRSGRSFPIPPDKGRY